MRNILFFFGCYFIVGTLVDAKSLEINPMIDHQHMDTFRQPEIRTSEIAIPQMLLSSLSSVRKHPLAPILSVMKKGQWTLAKKKAITLRANTDSPLVMDALFLSGQIAEQLGEYTEAIDFYQQMLSKDANLPRPRFELAKVLFLDRQFNSARRQFVLLLSAQGLPEKVQIDIKKYIKAIDKQTFIWDFTFDLIPAENINQGSKNKVVTINGRPFVLSANSQAQSGIGMKIYLAGKYQFGNKKQWFINGNIQHEEFSQKQWDISTFRLGAGHQWYGSKQKLSLATGKHHTVYQHKKLYHGWYIDGQYQYRINHQLLAFLYGSIQSQKYFQMAYRYLDGYQTTVGSGVNIQITPSTSGSGLLSFSHNKSQDGANSFNRYRFTAGIRHNFNFQAISVEGNVDYQYKKYNGKSPFFEIFRQDKYLNMGFFFQKRDWHWHGFAPRIGFGFVHNQSNIPLYEYQNKYITFNIRKVF